MRERERAHGATGEHAERQRPSRRQGHGRDQHRRDEKNGEGVLEAAGEIEEARELQDIGAQQQRREPVAEAMAHREAQREPHIEQGRSKDHAERQDDRHAKAEAETDDGHGDRLPENREPAQPDESAEAQALRAREEAYRVIIGHGSASFARIAEEKAKSIAPLRSDALGLSRFQVSSSASRPPRRAPIACDRQAPARRRAAAACRRR